MELAAMGRKKREESPRTVGVNIKARDEWSQWLREGADHCGLSVSDVVDQAVRLYLRRQGFEKPAPKR